MSKTNIIGFYGKAGSGKDTAASYLVEKHDYAHVKFAHPLKEICSESFNIPIFYLEDETFKDEKFEKPFTISEKDYIRFTDVLPHNFVSDGNYDNLRLYMVGKEIESPRHLLQWIGTDVIRNRVSPTFWTRLAKQKIEYWQNKGENKIVFSDLRFPNEAKMIRDMGGTVVEIERMLESEMVHDSEQQDIDVDAIVQNFGTIEDLHESLEEILNER